ncbi:TlpA family protein disulfide reductase [Thauera linaloolentis]|uniref:Putative thioredoxin n=1 Tax=Thauera linaloolentis (strain DSM 12138 / JCM 21573 / CCUG 41526 / CIP 105981 / IAM 15112 / NBRC 102519 / 47Lol) TaxID=1123367 RepID=N6YUB9_THAL4|nr:TlpA disulfide reductase family protein [Thauera linaloolentis]ENO85753.1 putative thioredoxin [Thauera linaloolentis 47Lol = DSM 12138]MCM8564193.1 TlpA family protein disulfide reductase [Thauera linaloolentis]
MNRKLQTLLILAVAILAGIGGYLANRSGETAPSTQTRQVPAQAIDALLALTLPDTDERPQALEQWRGKVIVANFWATWCPPCRKEIPDFAAASQALADQPVQFVGISVDSLEKVRAFDDEFKVPYPLLIAGPDVLTLAAEFGNDARALPFTVIIDRDGKARHIKLGTLKRDELESKIRALLAS